MNPCEKLLNRINFDFPGLEKARGYAAEKNTEACMDAVIDYYRKRTKPVYLFDDTDIRKCTDPRVFSEAEQSMNHYIYGYQFKGDIDWLFNPTEHTSHDNEWSWSLFRNIYWQPLARAYVQTGDEKYAAEFAKQLESFAGAWPVDDFLNDSTFETKFKFPGHAWRTIETGMRIYTTWLPCFTAFRKSPSLDRNFWAVYLSMIYDHAEFLMSHYSNHERSSNWLSMECSALFQCGLMFPELKKAAEWKQTGYERAMHEVLYCFDADGVHMERTPIYHLVASIAFLQVYRLCILNGLPVPPYMLPVLEKSAEFVMMLIKPDLSTPMIGDADRDDLTTPRADRSEYEGMNLSFNPEDLNELRAYFRIMAELTGRKDFLYFATLGKKGSEPEKKDYAFTSAGIYVMRTGWKKHDTYFLVNGIQLERGERSTHSHNDQGHVELMIRGEDVLVDSGRYIYNSSSWKDWRHYITSACAHNTVYIDDHTMGEVPDVSRVRGVRTWCHEFGRKGGYDIIDISHNGYAFMDDPVFHRRRVIRLEGDVFIIDDQLTGLGKASHDLRLYFNFAPGKLDAAVHTVSQIRYVYTTEKQTHFNFVSSCSVHENAVMLYGSEDPKGGWISYYYPQRISAPQLYLHTSEKIPLRFITVITPEGITADTAVTLESSEIVVHTAGGADRKLVIDREEGVKL